MNEPVIVLDDDNDDDDSRGNKGSDKEKVEKGSEGTLNAFDEISWSSAAKKRKSSAKRPAASSSTTLQRPEKRQEVVLEANRCQDVLVRRSSGFDSGAFFSPRLPNKARHGNSDDNAIVIDDTDMGSVMVASHRSASKLHSMHLVHERQLSSTESEALRAMNACSERLVSRIKPEVNMNDVWNDAMTAVSELKFPTGAVLPGISTEIEQLSEDEMSHIEIGFDDLISGLAECQCIMNKATISELVKEVRRIHDKHSDAQRKSLLWTDLYHPRKTQFLCGCRRNGEQFSKWLSEWADLADAAEAAAQQAAEEAQKKKEREERWASSNCFDSSYIIATDRKWLEAVREETERKARSSLCVICGPGCCGKTAMVYACAKERGMEVIEMNASECRSSSAILQRVSNTAAAQRLKTVAPKDEDAESHTSRPKRKRKERTRRRLFLFDDADVVLDGDSNFYGALTKLASASEYPIVLTCRRRTVDLSTLIKSTKASTIKVSPPIAEETALFSTMIALVEMANLQDSGPSESGRGFVRAFFSNVMTVVRALPVETGLNGVLSYLQSCPISMITRRPLSEARISGLLEEPTTSQDILEAQLETTHLQGSDYGFDSWPQWAECTTTEQLESISRSFSDLDLFGSGHDESPWIPPKATTPFWHRGSKPSTEFEACLLKSNPSVKHHWTISHSNTFPLPPPSIPVPRAIFGVSRASVPMSSVCLTSLKQQSGSLTTAWSAEVLPALRRIVKLEQAREKAKLRRHFFHHLAEFTRADLEAIQKTCFPGFFIVSPL